MPKAIEILKSVETDRGTANIYLALSTYSKYARDTY
jgi:hypothetical protein